MSAVRITFMKNVKCSSVSTDNHPIRLLLTSHAMIKQIDFITLFENGFSLILKLSGNGINDVRLRFHLDSQFPKK